MKFTIDKSKFHQLTNDVYILKSSDINLGTILFKYIDLLALIEIVKNKKFKIRLRREFSDRRESGELYNPFTEHLLQVGEHVTDHYTKIWEGYKITRKESGSLLTSCFTTCEDELYSMWKSFTNTYTGIRITTTIGNFIKSIDYTGYEIYIGKVEYLKNDIGMPDFERYIYAKNYCYKTEDEVRMYFIPKNEITEKKNIKLDIDTTKTFSEILLSPFIPQQMKGSYLQLMKSIFPELKDRIKHSRILEK